MNLPNHDEREIKYTWAPEIMKKTKPLGEGILHVCLPPHEAKVSIYLSFYMREMTMTTNLHVCLSLREVGISIYRPVWGIWPWLRIMSSLPHVQNPMRSAIIIINFHFRPLTLYPKNVTNWRNLEDKAQQPYIPASYMK